MPSVAIVILTLNEAKRLAACVSCIPKGFPVFVVDSGSTDGTVSLARELGATVLENPWNGFAAQRNFALDRLREYDWLLFVDADELYAPAFFDWLDGLDSRPDVDVWQVSSRICIDGKVLKHAPAYPIYHPRLARTRTARFTNSLAGHGETVVDGLKVDFIDIPYEHYVTDDGMTSWLAKHIRLARMEVDAAQHVTGAGVLTWRRRLSGAMGTSFIRAPLRFVFHYVVAGGFLDGAAGFKYAMMYTWFELTKWLTRERGAA